MNPQARHRWQALFVLVCVFVLAAPTDLAARGGGGGGGGRGGGGGGGFGGGGGGFSRGGAAANGSIGGYGRSSGGSSASRSRESRSGASRAGAYQASASEGAWGSASKGQATRAQGQGGSGQAGQARGSGSSGNTAPGDSNSQSGSFENRTGETVDWSSSTTRTDDGLAHESSWESTSGASGSGSSQVKVEDGQVQSVDRSRQGENAQGETYQHEVSSERDGDWVVREGSTKTSTGIDTESVGAFKKTDDGFIAQGVVSGDEGTVGGSIVKDGDDVYARGAATDGDDVVVGRAYCNGGNCQGTTVKADIDDYYKEHYYYQPYYYGWYSCPYGSVQTWHSRYGTPIYGCSNVTVIHTTIALGSSSSSMSAGFGQPSTRAPREAQVTSAPVLMYEITPEVVVYATSYAPESVYAEKQGTRFFWAPGPKERSSDAKDWIAKASAMSAPSGNATVITYTIGSRIVYLTNERPAPGFYAEPSEQLFAWIPGVREPSEDEQNAFRTAITAQRAGGQAALDREVRKLEVNREPPPASEVQAPS